MPVLNYSQLPATVPQCVVTNITSNQIKALRATPIQLVAAPGAGYVILPVSASIIYYGDGATPYDVSSGGEMALLLGTNDLFGVETTFSADGVLTEAVDMFALSTLPSKGLNGGFAPFSECANLALNLKNIGGGEYVDGTGTMRVTVHYIKTRAS